MSEKKEQEEEEEQLDSSVDHQKPFYFFATNWGCRRRRRGGAGGVLIFFLLDLSTGCSRLLAVQERGYEGRESVRWVGSSAVFCCSLLSLLKRLLLYRNMGCSRECE